MRNKGISRYHLKKYLLTVLTRRKQIEEDVRKYHNIMQQYKEGERVDERYNDFSRRSIETAIAQGEHMLTTFQLRRAAGSDLYEEVEKEMEKDREQ